MVPKDLLYTKQHEWVRTDGSKATVGITDFAQNALGDITFVDLPPVGKAVERGQEACAIESCKAAASVYAPASGKVCQVNAAVGEDPSLVNSDCYGRGWIYQVELSDKGDLGTLLTPQQYEEFLAAA